MAGRSASERLDGRRLGARRAALLGALGALIASWLSHLYGNDREATAIMAAGGDAGLWAVGVLALTAAQAPLAMLLLASLLRPDGPAGRAIAVVAGVLTLALAAYLTYWFVPPDRVTAEGRRLPEVGWRDAAIGYGLAAACLAGAGLAAVLSGLWPSRHRERSGPTAR